MARDAAQTYIGRNWQPVPLPAQSKAPKIPGWPERIFTADDFDPAGNVGIKMGAPSGGLVDVDRFELIDLVAK